MGWKTIAKKIVTGKLTRKEPVYIPKLQGSLLEGKSALVTGGTAGIGYSIAEAFLANGASVVVTGRSAARIEAAVLELEKTSGRCDVRGVLLDNSDPDSVEQGSQRAIEAGGGAIDILVNNAGLLKGEQFGRLRSDDFDEVINTNLRGTLLVSQVIANHMRDNGIEGNILNIASSSSLRPAVSAYTLSKWGLRGLTLGMAKTLIPFGIVVNGLAPGPTATAMLVKDDVGNLDNDRVPAGRYAAPEEIANMAVILTSSLGRMVVGDTVYMTGGSGVITYEDMSYDF